MSGIYLLTTMEVRQQIINYLISLGDNTLVLGQRLAEWCGHGPILEVDMALTNISLDLLGQTRSYYQHAAALEGKGRTEDDIAHLRDARDFRNVLLVEQENGDFAATIVRQFFFDAWHYLLLTELQTSNEEQIAAIAAKSIKEVKYHLRFSSEWVIRLGDGTEVSHQKMQDAVAELWCYTGEMCTPTALDTEMAELGIGPDLSTLQAAYTAKIEEVLHAATLTIPTDTWQQQGGKTGQHTERLGFLLADLQFLQRSHPGAKW